VDPERRIAELQSELAAKDVRIAEQDVRIAELTKAVAELTERLGRNSSNSNKPPSSDPPKNRAERRAQAKQDRKRGAQPGHTGSKRVLVAPEQVDEFVDLFPSSAKTVGHRCPSNRTRQRDVTRQLSYRRSSHTPPSTGSIASLALAARHGGSGHQYRGIVITRIGDRERSAATGWVGVCV
jgi:hypothetical protein